MNRLLQAAAATPMRSTLLALLLCFFLPASVRALDPQARFADYVRDNWNIESGLPQISALSITQDGTGYMWVATQSAITRFDGVRFTVFDRDTTGLNTTLANVAYTDRHGEVWFGTPHGALHFVDGKFEPLSAGQDNAAILAITDASDGGLLFATSVGVMRYDNGRLVPAMLEGEPSYSLLRDGTTLWVGVVGALVRVDARGVERYPLPTPASTARVTHLVGDSHALWIGTSSGLMKFADGHIAPANLGPELDRVGIESLFRDSDSNLWIGTAPMLFRLRPDSSLERIGTEDFTRDSWILAIYEDRERNLWLGSQTESLFRLWNGWTRRVSQRDGLSDPFVWSVARDAQGRVVLGTNSNVVALDADGAHELIAGKALPNPSAYELYFDKKNRLWVGTRGGVAIFADQKLERPAALRALDAYQINVVVQTGDNEYWIGTTGGLYHYRGDALTLVGPPPGGSSARVRAIYLIDANDLLVGTEAGIREVRNNGMETPAWGAPLEGRFVSLIAPLKPGLLGISTLDAGFALFADGKLNVVTRAQGLPSDNGWSFRVINGWVYVSGLDGVWRVPLDALPDPARSATRNVLNAQTILSSSGREPGSQRARCCNGGASARMAVDGTSIWLPSISGALRLDTPAIVEQAEPPTVVVENIRYDGDNLSARSGIELSGPSRDVEIDYTGLSFRDPGRLRFRYQLQGYDQGWIQAGTRRAAYYTNLPPGDYRFEVQVAQSGANGSVGALSFSMPPRWYEIGWVRVVLALAIIGVLAGLVMLRTRQMRSRQLHLERLVEDRTRALSRSNERLRQANLALEQASETDQLTGLRNRRFMLEHVTRLMERGSENGLRPAFLLLDVDNFKQINDQLGHAAGDSILIQISQLLQNMNRADDELLRWGGEEFLVLLMRVTPDQALEIAERIRERIAAQAFSLGNGKQLQVTASIGFALHPLVPDARIDWATTLEIADTALYRVKQSGRNACAGLIAGRATPPANLRWSRELPHIDELVEAGYARWLRPQGSRHLRLVGSAESED